jgi:hypothetical protein
VVERVARGKLKLDVCEGKTWKLAVTSRREIGSGGTQPRKKNSCPGLAPRIENQVAGGFTPAILALVASLRADWQG